MGSKRAPAIKEKAYVEIDLALLRQTGEIKITGAPIIAPEVTQKVPRGSFEITYCAELFDIMKELGNRKIQVLAYLLDHKDGNNCLNRTNSQLAEAIGVSRPTVIETIKTLSEAGLARRENSVLMISPGLMVKGSQVREAWLMRKYVSMPENSEPLDSVIEDQLAIGEDGDIVERVK